MSRLPCGRFGGVPKCWGSVIYGPAGCYCKPEPVAVPEKPARREAKLQRRVAELERRVAELERRVAELDAAIKSRA